MEVVAAGDRYSRDLDRKRSVADHPRVLVPGLYGVAVLPLATASHSQGQGPRRLFQLVLTDREPGRRGGGFVADDLGNLDQIPEAQSQPVLYEATQGTEIRVGLAAQALGERVLRHPGTPGTCTDSLCSTSCRCIGVW